MMRWLYSWEEAARRPWRAVLSVSLSGLVVGGLMGYLRFGHSVGYGVGVGLGVAVVLGALGWRAVRRAVENPAPQRKRRSLAPRGAAIRLALPFVAIGVAAVAGAASASATVFVFTLFVGLIVGLVLRRFVPR